RERAICPDRHAGSVLEKGLRCPLFKQLNTAKEKELLLPNRAAYGAAKLIEPQDRWIGAIEFIPRIQRVVAEILKGAAMVSIPAALRNETDLSAASGAELRRIITGVHP